MGVAIGLVLGLVGGSTVTALTYRIPAGLPLWLDRSRCPSCSHPIRARDNVPILAYLWLRGRCRDCATPIPMRYPLTELTGALIGVTAALLPVDNLAQLGCGIALLVGLAAALIDYETYRIPNRLTYPTICVLICLALANTLIDRRWGNLADGLAVSVAVLLFFVLLRWLSRGGMGLGDAKLAVVLALGVAPLGIEMVALAVLCAFFAGSVVGVGLILTHRSSLRSQLPFGPFLTVGFLVVAIGTSVWHL